MVRAKEKEKVMARKEKARAGTLHPAKVSARKATGWKMAMATCSRRPTIYEKDIVEDLCCLSHLHQVLKKV